MLWASSQPIIAFGHVMLTWTTGTSSDERNLYGWLSKSHVCTQTQHDFYEDASWQIRQDTYACLNTPNSKKTNNQRHYQTVRYMHGFMTSKRFHAPSWHPDPRAAGRWCGCCRMGLRYPGQLPSPCPYCDRALHPPAFLQKQKSRPPRKQSPMKFM